MEVSQRRMWVSIRTNLTYLGTATFDSPNLDIVTIIADTKMDDMITNKLYP